VRASRRKNSLAFGQTRGVLSEALILSSSFSFEHDVDAIENRVECRLGQVTGALAQERSVDRDDLRNIRHGIFGESRCPHSQKNVSRRGCETEIARKRNDNYGRDSASIEGVSLNDQDGPSKARSRSCRVRKIRPTHVALDDYHSVDSSRRRAASESDG
jgi:hypothetical protein